MTVQGQDQVVVSGVVDFAHRSDSFTLTPARGAGSYPPYEARFVDGWSYIEIDAAVRRPPTLRADAKWIAFRDKRGLLPVPDRALPPGVVIDTIGLPLTQPYAEARFLDGPGSGPRRVSLRFRRGVYSGEDYTYSIDANGRIVVVSTLNAADGQGTVLAFVYGPIQRSTVAPSDGVQRLAPGENLYPTPTTAPTS